MQRVFDWIARRPWTVVALFVAAFVAAATVQARYSRYDMSYRTMAPRDTPEFAIFENFVEVFGESNDVFLIAFAADPMVTNENLAMIETIGDAIESLEYTRTVTSIANVKDIRGAGDTLDVVEFVGDLPLDDVALADARARLLADPIVGGTLLSADGTTTAIVVRIVEPEEGVEKLFPYFEFVDRTLAEAGGDRIDFHLAGYPHMQRVLMGTMISETQVLFPLVLSTMAVLLWLVFRSVRAMWMPLVPVVVASTAALGLLTACGLPMSLLTGQGVLATLLLVIGLADGVHLLNRYDEDRAAAPDDDATKVLGRTVAHVGAACALTSLTTAIGFVSLAFANVTGVRDFGVFGAAGIGFAYAGAVVLLPALMLLTERWRRPHVRRGEDTIDRVLTGVTSFVVRFRRPIIACALIVLAGSAAMVPLAVVDNRPSLDLGAEHPARQGLDFLERRLGGAYPLDIVVEGAGPDAVKSPALLEAIERVRAGVEALPTVSRVTSPGEYIRKMNRAVHGGDPEAYALPASPEAVAQNLLLFEMGGGDGEFDRLVTYDYAFARMSAQTVDCPPDDFQTILDRIDALASDGVPDGARIYASGESPVWYTATRELIGTLISSLYFAMPLVFAVTAVAFRSWRLGVLSVLPNLLPLTLGLGILAPLDITLRFSTITAFPVAFGLAIDDTIHFLARYHAEVRAGARPEEAVRRTIRTTGRAMLVTSVLLIAGFSVFYASSFVGILQVAILISVILLAALFGDLLLMPALLLTFAKSKSATGA